jgi:hypothetical protein
LPLSGVNFALARTLTLLLSQDPLALLRELHLDPARAGLGERPSAAGQQDPFFVFLVLSEYQRTSVLSVECPASSLCVAAAKNHWAGVRGGRAAQFPLTEHRPPSINGG